MKKVCKVMAVLLALMTFAVMLTACDADYDGIEEKLKENDFTVYRLEDGDTSDLSLNALAIFGLIGNTVAAGDIEEMIIGIDTNMRFALVATLSSADIVKGLKERIGSDAVVKTSGRCIYITKDENVMKIIR